MRNGARTSSIVFIRNGAKEFGKIASHLRVFERHMTGMCLRTSEESSRVHSKQNSSVSALFITHFFIRKRTFS